MAGRLRLGAEDRAEADVVGSFGFGAPRLFEFVRREPYDQFIAGPFPRGGERHIFLSQVDAVRADRERDVEAVVDDQLRAGAAREIARRLGQGEKYVRSEERRVGKEG